MFEVMRFAAPPDNETTGRCSSKGSGIQMRINETAEEGNGTVVGKAEVLECGVYRDPKKRERCDVM